MNRVLQNTDTLSNIFNSIDNNLYQTIKYKIINNETNKNNIIIYLTESLHLSSYLMIQYLSECLINIDNEYSSDDIEEIFKLIKIDMGDINTNFLFKNVEQFKIPSDINILILNNIMEEKEKELKYIESELKEQDDNIKNLDSSKKILADKIRNSHSYRQNYNNVKNLKKQIDDIKKMIKDTPSDILNNDNYNDDNIIKNYDYYENGDYGLRMEAWIKLFNQKLDKTNYNISPLLLLLKQKEIFNNTIDVNFNKTSQSNELDIITKSMGSMAKVCEMYFDNEKYTENNIVLEFIYDALVHITKLVFGYGIINIIRRILFIHLTNKYSKDISLKDITKEIDVILDNNLIINGSLKDILYNEVCPKIS
jgi:hypothetical protein